MSADVCASFIRSSQSHSALFDANHIRVSFTMLTVNADNHPLMKRFHKPGDEKRSVVIVRPDAHAYWLNCRSTDEARSFLNLYPAEQMAAEAYPLPPRKPATAD